MTGDIIVIVHAAATWAMVGLIWFVQLVHYPLFAAVGAPGFAEYESQHTRRTTWVVAAFMPIEAGTAVLLTSVDAVAPALAWTGAALVAVVWAVTLTIQVPQHRALGSGFHESIWHALVRGNWVRTTAWSIRGMLVAVMLASL